ncbi:hypothetical protein CsSME_00031425 [Camellia sinensis var. sinensis]
MLATKVWPPYIREPPPCMQLASQPLLSLKQSIKLSATTFSLSKGCMSSASGDRQPCQCLPSS